jgi:hypothetical protein
MKVGAVTWQAELEPFLAFVLSRWATAFHDFVFDPLSRGTSSNRLSQRQRIMTGKALRFSAKELNPFASASK